MQEQLEMNFTGQKSFQYIVVRFCCCATQLKTKQQQIMQCILHSLSVALLNVYIHMYYFLFALAYTFPKYIRICFRSTCTHKQYRSACFLSN